VASTTSQAISAANIAAAAQMAASLQLNGLLSLLTQTSHPSSGLSTAAADPTVLHPTSATSFSSWQLPSSDQVRQAALKALQDCPPFVHLSKVDSAPQLKILDDRLTLKGGMRGYRMSRATHGVSQGQYYYELLVLPPPTVSEIVASLPPNARLGPSLQKQIQEALEYEKRQQNASSHPTTKPAEGEEAAKESEEQERTSSGGPGRKRKVDAMSADDQNKPPPQVGGHLRVGWSLRSGDLQAPVGYDKWSYGFRNIAGSKIHQSRREDMWGGESWGPGDVIGCAIFLNPKSSQGGAAAAAGGSSGDGTPQNNNHIRFFKNGEPMGHFIITKGKREGGAAFENIDDGTYYPAISSYLGGSVKVNFGPYFIYPPRKLPHGFGKLQPVSSLQKPPLSKQEILSRLKPSMFSRAGKAEITPEKMLQAFKEAILAESEVLQEAHQQHKRKHLQEVLGARKERNLNVADVQQEFDEMTKKEEGQVADAVEKVLNKDSMADKMEM
jgi:Set1/Ash2 histone methyltransferase complex subunit ASH2